MSVNMRDVLNLEIMKDFKIIAGEKGLKRKISRTEILDFEFVREGREYRDKSFDGESLVLTSLLFAKEKPELILQSVRNLVELNVCALAYKPIFFKELPKEVIDYADKIGFLILEFGKDEFFEDIIFSVSELVKRDKSVGITECLIGRIIAQELLEADGALAWEQINPNFRSKIQAVFIRDKELDEKKLIMEIDERVLPEKMQSRIFFGKYKKMYMLILSDDEGEEKQFDQLLKEVLRTYRLSPEKLIMGISSRGSLKCDFGKIVREAYWAEKIAEIENKNVIYYNKTGIYKLLAFQINNQQTVSYMRTYLKPLFEEEDKDGELLKTALEYVYAHGDIIKTADKMFCHKNTIRYRIGKLQEKLDPNVTEKDFYQNLSIAIKIYLLVNKNNENNEKNEEELL